MLLRKLVIKHLKMMHEIKEKLRQTFKLNFI